MPYVQCESVDDIIPKPRGSKFAVGLQTERSKLGVQEARSDSGQSTESDGSSYVHMSVRACARGSNLAVMLLSVESIESSPIGRERIPYYR